MPIYYANKNAPVQGNHTVHMKGCSHLPKSQSRLYIGLFTHSSEAIKEARYYFSRVKGCNFCSSPDPTCKEPGNENPAPLKNQTDAHGNLPHRL